MPRSPGGSRETAFLLALSLLLGAACFFPLFLGVGEQAEARVKDSILSSSIRAPEVVYLTSISAAILLPLLVDTLLDSISYGLNPALMERGYFLMTIFFSFVGQVVTNSSPIATTFYGCSFIFQLWILCSASLIILNRVSPMYTNVRVALILCFAYIYVIAQILTLTFGSTTTQVVADISKYLCISFILIINIAYFTYTVKIWRASKLSLIEWMNSMNGETHTGIVISFGLLSSVFTYAILAIIFNSRSGITFITSKFLASYLCLSIALNLAISILPQRFLKAHANKVSSELELKKTFVRYISHELRTPISICLTGLDLAEEQLKRGASTREVLSTIQDLKQPCLTGVDILNKLLDFEKLEAGLTVIEKTKQDPSLFLMSTIEPFYLVARMKNVNLQVTSELIPGQYAVDIDETKVNN